MNRVPTLLSGALCANAVFSGASGAALLVFPSWWARLFETLDAPVYAALGAGLLGFAGILVWIIRDQGSRLPYVRWIIVADIAWILATPVVMLLGADAISTAGQYLLIFVGVMVALLALLQWRGMHRKRVPIRVGIE